MTRKFIYTRTNTPGSPVTAESFSIPEDGTSHAGTSSAAVANDTTPHGLNVEQINQLDARAKQMLGSQMSGAVSSTRTNRSALLEEALPFGRQLDSANHPFKRSANLYGGIGGGVGNGGGGGSFFSNMQPFQPEFSSPDRQMFPNSRKIANSYWRLFYKMDPVIGSVIDLFSTLPWGDFQFTGEGVDGSIKETLEHMVNETRLKSLLPYLVAEYLITGETIPHTFWDDGKGIWSHLALHNPDQVNIVYSPFVKMDTIMEYIPDSKLKELVTSNHPQLARVRESMPPKLISHLQSGENIPLSPVNATFIPRKLHYYDLRGTSIITRLWRTLMLEDCFVKGTPISMRDGSTLPIEEVRIDHEVLDRTGKYARVTNVVTKKAEKLRRFSLPGGMTFTSTLTHKWPVWTNVPDQVGSADGQQKKEAKDILAGDFFLVPRMTEEGIQPSTMNVLSWSFEGKKAVVEGFFLSSGEEVITEIEVESGQLASQLFLLCAQVGRPIIKTRVPNGWLLSLVVVEPNVDVSVWLDEEYVYYPIRKIEDLESEEDVYGLTVEGDHSYLVDGIATYNSIWSATIQTARRAACFVAGTKILTEQGIRPIEEIKAGDKVISGTGRVETVETAWAEMPDDEGLVEIRATGTETLLCTPHHKFPVWAAPRCCACGCGQMLEVTYDPTDKARRRAFINGHHLTTLRDKTTGQMTGGSSIDWKVYSTAPKVRAPKNYEPLQELEAKDLRRGDYLLIPRKFDVCETAIRSEQARLLGYYAAEGSKYDYSSATRENGVVEGVSFTFSLDEAETWAEDVVNCAKSLGYTAKLYKYIPGPDTKTTQSGRVGKTYVYLRKIADEKLVRWLKQNAGVGSKNLTLSSEVMRWPLELKEEFIKGYFRGDGHLGFPTKMSTQCPQVTSSSVSVTLSYQVRIILAQLGFIGSITHVSKKKQKGKENWNDSWIVSTTGRDARVLASLIWGVTIDAPERGVKEDRTKEGGGARTWKDDNYIYLPVTKIVAHSDKQETTYNLSVTGDHSYVANGVSTRNSPLKIAKLGDPATGTIPPPAEEAKLLRLLAQAESDPQAWLCLRTNTLVNMADGSYKTAGTVLPGDMLLDKEGVSSRVNATKIHTTRESVVIHLAGGGLADIECTPTHYWPIFGATRSTYTGESHQKIRARYIRRDDFLKIPRYFSTSDTDVTDEQAQMLGKHVAENPNKELPKIVMQWSLPLKFSFLLGYISAPEDKEKIPRLRFINLKHSITSVTLAFQLQKLFAQLGTYTPIQKNDDAYVLHIQGPIVDSLVSRTYSNLQVPRKANSIYWSDDKYVYVKIEDVIFMHREFPIEVATISVEGDHSYQVQNIGTYNCYNYMVQFELAGAPERVMSINQHYDLIERIKLCALGVSRSFISGESSYSSAAAGLTVFLQRLKSIRDFFVNEWLLPKFFLPVAVMNEWVKPSKMQGRGQRGLVRVKRSAKDLNDHNRFIVPTLEWSKSLDPQIDKDMIDAMTALEQQLGIKITDQKKFSSIGLDSEEQHKQLIEELKFKRDLAGKDPTLQAQFGLMPNDEGGGGGGSNLGGMGVSPGIPPDAMGFGEGGDVPTDMPAGPPSGAPPSEAPAEAPTEAPPTPEGASLEADEGARPESPKTSAKTPKAPKSSNTYWAPQTLSPLVDLFQSFDPAEIKEYDEAPWATLIENKDVTSALAASNPQQLWTAIEDWLIDENYPSDAIKELSGALAGQGVIERRATSSDASDDFDAVLANLGIKDTALVP